MARPEPKIIKEYFKENSTSVLQVCEVENNRGIYVVVYRGRPFQYRGKYNIEVEYPGWKYLRTSFPNSGHAFRLADKLNKYFDSTEFEVVEMSYGTTISPDKYK
jgi:hypothetical protein